MISALYTSNYYFLVKHGNGKSSIVVFLVDFSVERHPFTGDFPSQPGCIKPFFLPQIVAAGYDTFCSKGRWNGKGDPLEAG